MNENTVASLNNVYEKKLLYYWCNSCGDINMPGYPIGSSPDVGVLPSMLRDIYLDYKGEGRGANEYVVTYNGQNGLALQWLFDYSWLRDLGLMNDENQENMKDELHTAVREAAVELQKEWECPVLFGTDTDPDGDEILMFIEARQLWYKGKLRELVTKDNGARISEIGEGLYEKVGVAVKAAFIEAENLALVEIVTEDKNKELEVRRIINSHALSQHDLAVIAETLRLRPGICISDVDGNET